MRPVETMQRGSDDAFALSNGVVFSRQVVKVPICDHAQ